MKTKNILPYFILGVFTPCWLLAQSESISIPLPHLCGGGSNQPRKPVSGRVVTGEGGGAGVVIEAIAIGMETEETMLRGRELNNNSGIATDVATFARGGRTENRFTVPSAPRSKIMSRCDESKEGEEQDNLMINTEVAAVKKIEEQAWSTYVEAKKNFQQCGDEMTILLKKETRINAAAEIKLAQAERSEARAQVIYNKTVNELELCNKAIKDAIFRAADRTWIKAGTTLVMTTNVTHTPRKTSASTIQTRQAIRVKLALQKAYDVEKTARDTYIQAAKATYEERKTKYVEEFDSFWTNRLIRNAQIAENARTELTRGASNMATYLAVDRAEFIAATDIIVKLQATNALAAQEAIIAETKRALEAQLNLQSKMTDEIKKATEVVINERRGENTENENARTVDHGGNNANNLCGCIYGSIIEMCVTYISRLRDN